MLDNHYTNSGLLTTKKYQSKLAVRLIFSKSIELINVTTEQVLDAVQKLNSRPRICLGYEAPYEVFENLAGISQKELEVMHL